MKHILIIVSLLFIASCAKDNSAERVPVGSSSATYNCTYTYGTHGGSGPLTLVNYNNEYWIKSKLNVLTHFDSIRVIVSGNTITIPPTTTNNKGPYHGTMTVTGSGSKADPAISLNYSGTLRNTDGNGLYDATYFFALTGTK